MLVKDLKAYHRSFQKVGILRDGTLYLDCVIYDDEYGDSANTDYFDAADVARMKALLCGLGLEAQADAELLDVIAELFDTTVDARNALHALGFRSVSILDFGARFDVSKVMPAAPLGSRHLADDFYRCGGGI